LRYTLEIARPIYSGRLDAALGAIKQVQTLLGEVHDCDVWQEQLDRFAKEECDRIKSYYGHAGPFTRLNAGIEYLRQDRLRHHQQCFEQLVRLWGELDIQESWENLVGIVQSDGKRPETSEASDEAVNIVQSTEIAKKVDADRVDTVYDANSNRNQEASPALFPPSAHPSGKHAKHRHPTFHRAPVIS
jgi:hypothetical protein